MEGGGGSELGWASLLISYFKSNINLVEVRETFKPCTVGRGCNFFVGIISPG